MARIGRPKGSKNSKPAKKKKALPRGKKLSAAQLKMAARQLGAKGGKKTARKNKKLATPIKAGFWNRK